MTYFQVELQVSYHICSKVQKAGDIWTNKSRYKQDTENFV